MSINSDQPHLSRTHSTDQPGKENCEEGSFLSNEWQPSTDIPSEPTNNQVPDGTTPHLIEPYPADAFTAMTFCFSDFEDDTPNVFDEMMRGGGCEGPGLG
jgi:hypothetical protein